MSNEPKTKTKKVEVPEPKLVFIQKTIKDDTYTVLASSRMELEDEFTGLYFNANSPERILLMPPYEPKELARLVVSNNILAQCVQAMEVNVDGTGYEFVPKDETKAKPELPPQAPKPPVKPGEKPPTPEPTPAPVPDATSVTKAVVPFPPKPGMPKPGQPGQPGVVVAHQPPPVDPDVAHAAATDKYNQDVAQFNIDQEWEKEQAALEEERKNLEAFFNEPYPGQSFSKIRRKLRRDMESVGWGFLEVLRNIADEVVGLRNINTTQTRMVKLDAPVTVTKTLTRNGKEVQLSMLMRERRFVQIIPGQPNKFMYFREYGGSRQVDRLSGWWEGSDNMKSIPVEQRGGELLIFGVLPDIATPYFVPRWINNLPSVVGSRKAEEENLEFFDAGGIPPAIIFIEGGTLGANTAEQLRGYLSGQAKTRNRAVIVEAQSNSGAIDQASQVKVHVERFGSSGKQDSMWASYDKATEEHVRRAFRLPPLFLGDPKDYNFATALTAYMVAEAQVFQPERQEFDDVMNKTIMKEIGAVDLKFRSLPVTLKNVEIQLQAMGMIADKVDGKGLVDEINKIAGVTLDYVKPEPVPAALGGPPGADAGMQGLKDPKEPGNVTALPTAKVKTPTGVLSGMGIKSERMNPMELIELVNDYSVITGKTPQKFALSPTRKNSVRDQVAALHPEDERMFYELYAAVTLPVPVEKTERAINCTEHHHPQETMADVLAPVVHALAQKDERADAVMMTMTDMVRSTQETAKELITAISKRDERPIQVTAVIQPKPPTNKSFTFSDGRKVTLKEGDNE